MDENLAVLLGLGLGGIGGYFGSKNRRESEAERLAMLLDAQKPDPNVESDAIKLLKLQNQFAIDAEERAEALRLKKLKEDAETDAANLSLSDITDLFTDGISYDTINKGKDLITGAAGTAKDFITNLGDSAVNRGAEAVQAYDDFLGDRTLLQALGEKGEDLLYGGVDIEDLGKIFPAGNVDQDFYIPGMQTTGPSSNITNKQIANVGEDEDQMLTNLAETAGGDTYLRGMPTDADQDFFIPPELMAQDNPNISNLIEFLGGNEALTQKGEERYINMMNIPRKIKKFMLNNPVHDYFYDSGAQLQGDLSGAYDTLYNLGAGANKAVNYTSEKANQLYDTLYNLGAGTNELYNDIVGIPGDIKDFMDYAEIFNKGGRVGLANGGLGYSYKNNIFSADPSTGIPAVVDAGGDDGVADDTFLNLYPGLFPPVTDPVEKIMDTPTVPMGGGGDGGLNNPLSGNYTGGSNIPFGENPMYGPSSGYDPDDPENSFLDKLGYGFYSNVALPTATMMKNNPFSFANILGSVFGDKDGDGDGDAVKKDFKLSDLFSNPDSSQGDGGNKPGPTTTDTDASGGISDAQKKSGGGGGGSSPSPGKSKTGSAGPGGAGGRAKGGKYK